MSDYISREEAEKRIDEALRRVFVEPVGKSILSKLPAADVRPVVRGRWILDSDPGEPWRYICSECGEKTTDTCMGEPRANFCPNCGADMREEAQ